MWDEIKENGYEFWVKKLDLKDHQIQLFHGTIVNGTMSIRILGKISFTVSSSVFRAGKGIQKCLATALLL